MASVSDVRYAQLQYEENRAFGEGLRKQQEGLDQKRGRMGLGRTLLSFAGGAIGTAGGPVGMAIGAGLGSALGSFLGGASTGKIDEIEKGKLYKATADEARRQGRDAQVYMKKMAVRGALSDAASAFFFAGTDIGKAAQVGSAEKLSGLGADANLLQKAWASGSGAVGGGAGHIKASIAEMQNEAFEGTFAGDLEGTLADTATVDPMMATPTDPTGIRAWNPDATVNPYGQTTPLPGPAPEFVKDLPLYTGEGLGVGGSDIGAIGADITTKRTHQLAPQYSKLEGLIAQNNAAGITLPQLSVETNLAGQLAGINPVIDSYRNNFGTSSSALTPGYDVLANINAWRRGRVR